MKRSDFYLDPEVVFLNHGSFGACPQILMVEQQRWQRILETEPVAFFHALPQRMKAARQALASFVGAKASDLVFVQNSTYGANVMAYAMARYLNPGDEVLIPDHEYGACRRAFEFHLRGTGISIGACSIPLPVPPDDHVADIVIQAITPRTRAIFISHITSPTACLLPIERIGREAQSRGILMLVDGAHAPGHIPVNLSVLPADMYTANCHKWMCLPKGSGFLWVSPAMQKITPPLVASWGNTWLSEGDGEFIDEHEYIGTRDPSAFLTIHEALRWMEGEDWWGMVEHAHALVKRGMQELTSIPTVRPVSADWPNHKLMMGAVLLPDGMVATDVQRLFLRDYNLQIICMEWLAHTILRFSVHGYTTPDEVQVMINAVQALLAQR